MYNTVLALFVLLGFHMIADYPLQGEFLAQQKGNNKYLLFVHSIIYSFVMTFALAICGVSYGLLLFAMVYILATHIVIDQCKCGRANRGISQNTDLYIDQACHIIINSAIFLLWS